MSLAGSTYRVNLDFGRETGTWMPPRWASYGRTEFALDLKYAAGGVVEVVDGPRPVRGLALGTNYRWGVTGGTWRVDTDAKTRQSTLRVQLAHDGLSVADCVLDAGDVSLSIPVFVGQSGTTVSRKEGLMSIVAYRLLVRKERRLVAAVAAGEDMDAYLVREGPGRPRREKKRWVPVAKKKKPPAAAESPRARPPPEADGEN